MPIASGSPKPTHSRCGCSSTAGPTLAWKTAVQRTVPKLPGQSACALVPSWTASRTCSARAPSSERWIRSQRSARSWRVACGTTDVPCSIGRSVVTWCRRTHLSARSSKGARLAATRVLTDEELGEAWRATCKLSYPYGPFIGLLMLSLQRRGEVAGMRWREFSPDLSAWKLPAHRTKNGKEHVVHLPEVWRGPSYASCRGSRGPIWSSTSALVGSQRRPARTLKSGHGRYLASRMPRSGCWLKSQRNGRTERRRWLRSTGASMISDAQASPCSLGSGFSPHVADRLLNHVQGTIRGVAAVYQRHEFLADRQAALRIWADHVLAVGERRQAADGNVVQLRELGRLADLAAVKMPTNIISQP